MAVYRADRPRPFKKHHRVRGVLFIALSLMLLGGVGYGVYLFIQKDTAPAEAIDSKATDLGYYDPSQTFTTVYFNFKAPKSWRFEEKESSANEFVYRSYAGPNIEQELRILVNQAPKDQRVTHVLPIVPSESSFATGTVSDRCSSYLPKSNFYTNPADLVYEGAKYSCWTDNTQSIMGVSAVGGGSIISLKRRDGSTGSYFFRYLDSRFSARYQDAVTILSTFRAL